MKRSLVSIVIFASVVFVALLNSGCTIDKEGSPRVQCPPIELETEITPPLHSYRGKGFCFLKTKVVPYELSAEWSLGRLPSDNKAKIALKVFYGGLYEASISAQCPEDPLLYESECHSRKIAGSLTKAPFWPIYTPIFKSGLVPSVFSDAQKAALRKEAEWPKTPPHFLLPEPTGSYRYKDPKNVVIAVQLPFTKGTLHNWRVSLHMEKLEPLSEISPGATGSTWLRVPDEYEIVEFTTRGVTTSGVTVLNLEPGKYRVTARAHYGMWYSDASYPAVEFLAAGKMLGSGKTFRPAGLEHFRSDVDIDFGVRRIFGHAENILVKLEHDFGKKAECVFQRRVQNSWQDFRGATIVRQNTKKMNSRALTELTFQIKEPGKFRIRAGKSQWIEFEVKSPPQAKSRPKVKIPPTAESTPKKTFRKIPRTPLK